MAGKPKDMSQIKQVLRMYQQGLGKKKIAISVGLSKTTINAYLHKIASSGWNINELLSLEDFALECRFHAGNPAYSDNRFDYIKSRLEYYEKELNRGDYVTRRLLWEEYRNEHPGGYSYGQFCFHIQQHLLAHKPSMVLHHEPADKLFIDFAGKTTSYVDASTGEVKTCQLFTACLPYSGYSFAIAVESQTVDNFTYALSQCLKYIGGVPSAIVPDNLKSAVIKANRYEPDINKALEDFANHYGTVVLPTRVCKPKDKALVEKQVHLTYTHVLAKLRNEQFFSLQSLNDALLDKTHLLNQTRMQKKPYSREEKFIADEKPLLKELPCDDFQIKYYKIYKVAQNNHIFLADDKHYYSVPYTYISKKVKVIYTRTMVHIYEQGKEIAVHQRSLVQGGYSTIKEHLCSQHQHYLSRSPDYYINKAGSISTITERLFRLIFQQNKHPEQLYRSCDGLLHLSKKISVERFDKACLLAIEYQNYSYQFILKIIENNMMDYQIIQTEKNLPTHHNIRGKNYYEQLTLNLN